jgi:hypothetical protein
MMSADLDFDSLAREMTGMGFGEYVDFYIANRANGTLPSSEHIGLFLKNGVYEVWYRDMGTSRDLLVTTKPDEARRLFIEETRRLVAERRPGSKSAQDEENE